MPRGDRRDPCLPSSRSFVCENPAVLAAVSDSVGERAVLWSVSTGCPPRPRPSRRPRRAWAARFATTATSTGTASRSRRPRPQAAGGGPVALRRGGLPVGNSSRTGRHPSTGRTVASPWEAALGDEMAAVGVAVYEEQVIGQLCPGRWRTACADAGIWTQHRNRVRNWGSSASSHENRAPRVMLRPVDASLPSVWRVRASACAPGARARELPLIAAGAKLHAVLSFTVGCHSRE